MSRTVSATLTPVFNVVHNFIDGLTVVGLFFPQSLPTQARRFSVSYRMHFV
ncbi:MAG TPA: hypothetical protein VIE89_11865 [Candidatus Binatia bacterium]